MSNKNDEKLLLKDYKRDENGKLVTTKSTIDITLSQFESDELICNKPVRDYLLDFIQEGYEDENYDVEKFQIMSKDEVLYEICEETKGLWRNVKYGKEINEILNGYFENGLSV